MSVIKKLSTYCSVLKGKHEGRVCNVRPELESMPGFVKVVFVDRRNSAFVDIAWGLLMSIEKPGWKDDASISSYDLPEYLNKHRGNGSNLLRTELFVQPRAMKVGDQLASGQTVMEKRRMGYNSSSLLKLDKSGWVEMASRLPLALAGNKNFKFPIELLKNDQLVTSCVVGKKSVSSRVDWTNIWLDHIEEGFEVPSCLPLAMG